MLTTTASIFHIYLYTPIGYVKYRADTQFLSRDYVRKVALMIFNKNINQTYDKSGIKSGVKKIFQKNNKLSNKVVAVIVYIL